MAGDGYCRDCGSQFDRDDIEVNDGKCGSCNRK